MRSESSVEFGLRLREVLWAPICMAGIESRTVTCQTAGQFEFQLQRKLCFVFISNN